MVHPLLTQIVSSKTVLDKTGNPYALRGEISQEEGDFLWNLIRTKNIEKTIEVGCAFGISSLHICDALSTKAQPHHVILDPYQSSYWHGVGIANLDRAGFGFYEFIEKPSEIALPELMAEGRSFDLAFVDGGHVFDLTIMNFLYLSKMVRVGGYIVFDDCGWPEIRRAMRFIVSNYPEFEVVGIVGNDKTSIKRKILDTVKMIANRGAALVPRKHAREFFSDEVLHHKRHMEIRGGMIALNKVSQSAVDPPRMRPDGKVR